MHRCLQLASLAAGNVAPNPMVGAVLVYQNNIIGEGYHQQYGKPHAEVNCLNDVPEHLHHFIPQSTLYVSLEPCAHFGKTPPCADLIIKNKIPHVVVGIRDPFEAVNGKGIEKLRQAGVDVTMHVLENNCYELNKRFFTFHTKKRPYIILKWAQTADGFIASNNAQRLQISNELTNRLVHKWRSEEAAILIGTNTALADNPSLTNRLWTGNNPVRLVIDKQLRLPPHLQVFNQQISTIIFNEVKEERTENLHYYLLHKNKTLPLQICNALYQLNLQSVLIEGGSQVHQTFINEGCYDEIRLIENTTLRIGNGLPAPEFPALQLQQRVKYEDDCISIFQRNNQPGIV